MTSSKNAVSLLTAAALVVAPVGGVAANYKTAHADEGEGDDGHVREADETQEGKTLADVEYAKANGEYSSEADYAKDVQEALGNEAAPEEAPAPEESAESDGVGDGATEGEDTGEAAPEGSEGTPEGTLPPVDQNKPVEGEGEGEGTTKFEMPNLVDKSLEAAKSILAEAHLNLSDDIQYEFSAAPKGTVLSTNPAAGTTVNAGDTVQLVVSKGTEKVAVPDFKNMTLEEAMAALDPSCLTLSSEKPVYEFSDTVEAGRVIATSPAAGTVVDNGAAVQFTISKGADPDQKPDGGQEPGEDDGNKPSQPETPEPPVVDPSNPVDSGVQKPKPDGAGGTTDASHTAAVNKGQAQTPLKQVAVTVPSISFTHMDNSSYVARHYSEDLTTEKFISLVGESARTIAADNDLYASVMIAQAILESASGNSQLAQAPNNNLFGIKGTYKGSSVSLATREDDGSGATYTIMADFRQYDTVDESLSDYADLLSNSMGDFYAGARKSNTDTFVDACDFLVGRYATDIFYSEKLQDLIETYDLTRFDVPLTYELTETFVLPAKDEVTGLDLYLDPVADKEAYDALVAEYEAYVDATSEYQQALATWEEQMARAEELYHVPVYLEKPSVPAADTAMQQHQNAIDAERFDGFDKLIAAGAPLPVREARTLNDLTSLANSFLGVPYLWGGTTPAGFDCSGLVQYCYREVFNIELPRTTYYQCEVGVEVPFSELLPGDLLFFAENGDVHHVAMYLGDGYYVEAPHTGDVVKITAMNDKLPDFAKRVVEVRDVELSEYSDAQLAMFVEREKYLQEREQRMGVSDEALEELTTWLQGLEF
ncbi:PASTA domain-containing protein [Adlercreutzia muris]|uniref:PASTA domain-containing protein n=1 Tax=Adlercreutzia muris TaxID=1796610 RepID=UPI00351420DC